MKTRVGLALGDLLAIAIVTIIGFATHGENVLAALPRGAATYLPLCIAWFILAPWFGLFHPETVLDARLLWRPALAMFLAAPLAATLRGLILGAPVLPIFVLVLAATSALGMLVWRSIFLLAHRRARS